MYYLIPFLIDDDDAGFLGGGNRPWTWALGLTRCFLPPLDLLPFFFSGGVLGVVVFWAGRREGGRCWVDALVFEIILWTPSPTHIYTLPSRPQCAEDCLQLSLRLVGLIGALHYRVHLFPRLDRPPLLSKLSSSTFPPFPRPTFSFLCSNGRGQPSTSPIRVRATWG